MKVNFGFTLLELLIVIAIIGLLGSFIVVTFPASQGRARDAKRMEELKQYQIAWETYANKTNGSYYDSSGSVKVSTLCDNVGEPLEKYGSTCANDPKDGTSSCGGGTCQYSYNGTATIYVLFTRLERPTDSAKPCYVICSNGLSGDGVCPNSSACTL